MERVDDYRGALAANNAAIDLLVGGNLKQSVAVFRNAFRIVGLPQASLSRSGDSNTRTGVSPSSVTSLRGNDSTRTSSPPATILLSSFAIRDKNPHLRIIEEDDLEIGPLASSDGLVAIALRKIPSSGDDKTFSIQVASFLYNFGLSFLLSFQHYDSTVMSSRGGLLTRAKMLLRKAKAIIFPRLSSTSASETSSVSLINLAGLVLNALAVIYKIEHDVETLKALNQQQELLESFIEHANANHAWTHCFTANAA
jgi:hypothetical protein